MRMRQQHSAKPKHICRLTMSIFVLLYFHIDCSIESNGKLIVFRMIYSYCACARLNIVQIPGQYLITLVYNGMCVMNLDLLNTKNVIIFHSIIVTTFG